MRCLKTWLLPPHFWIWIQFPGVPKSLISSSYFDPAFHIWHDKGFINIKSFYKDGLPSELTELSTRFDLPKAHFFSFLQIRHFIKTTYPHFPNYPPGFLIDSELWTSVDSLNTDPAAELKQVWGRELGVPMSDAQRDCSLDLVHSCVPDTAYSNVR